MTSSLTGQVLTALSEYSSRTRLYELKFDDARAGAALSSLLVEAFSADEQLQAIGTRDVIALSIHAAIAHSSLLGQGARLEISLSDGTRARFGGCITEVATLGSDGSLTRYRLRLSSWVWLLGQVRNSRAWQDRSVIEIVDSVLKAYRPHAQWTWSGEVVRFMAGARVRSYCCQYRETDFDFVVRLLTEEGLAWRFEQFDGCERMVLFADTSYLSAAPEDASSAAGGGIRYHAASAVEKSDSIQYLQATRSLGVAVVTVLSYDDTSKQSVAVSVPTKFPIGGKNAQAVESFDCPGQYAYANARQARRYAGLQMEGHEARSFVWQARSTVRTLRAGTRVRINDIPMKKYRDEVPDFVLTRVVSMGVNNLPVTARNGLAELFGPIPELLEESLGDIELADFDKAIEQAQRSGYANCFEAIPAERPWRPMLDGSGGCSHTRATAHGSQSAIVVGPDGSHEPNGADEVYCDRLGRVRIRFHWQRSNTDFDAGPEADPDAGAAATCWVRVAQRSAGGGMGSQFTPRIGQEVLVKFIEGDIDQPVIVGALYNGQGEGGVPPTPGGIVDRAASGAVFERADDAYVSGQGNLTGGNSPVWHGASPDSAGHRNASAQWGIRSKEFGGRGYNQLLFDDTEGQGRIQLKSTQFASELNLGHLIHTADNHRGSFRGSGAELRTDAYGAVRAGAGLLISSYAISHTTASRDAAGENAAGNALLKQAMKLAESFSSAAQTHQSVAYASHLGAAKADASAIDDKAAPLKALFTTSAGMLSSESFDAAQADAESRNIDAGHDKLPHASGPMISISAQAGLGVVAGQDVQLANGETVSVMSGADTQFIAGGQLRIHSGQAIGVLAGAVNPGEGKVGLQLIAGKGAIDYQAQADELKLQARDQVNVISANAHIDWAAAKSISLSTAGGANITIAGGNITVQCPGKITIKAGTKNFSGPDRLTYPLPNLPNSNPPKEKVNFGLSLSDMPGAHGRALPDRPWNIVLLKMSATDAIESTHWRKVLASGTSDASGACVLTDEQKQTIWQEVSQHPQGVWLVSGPDATPMTFTRLAASAAELKARKTLDALNYALTPEVIDDEHRKLLSQWAEFDYGAPLGGKPTDQTKA
jgi:type VI secretion system secreted protein VgrG